MQVFKLLEGLVQNILCIPLEKCKIIYEYRLGKILHSSVVDYLLDNISSWWIKETMQMFRLLFRHMFILLFRHLFRLQFRHLFRLQFRHLFRLLFRHLFRLQFRHLFRLQFRHLFRLQFRHLFRLQFRHLFRLQLRHLFRLLFRHMFRLFQSIWYRWPWRATFKTEAIWNTRNSPSVVLDYMSYTKQFIFNVVFIG